MPRERQFMQACRREIMAKALEDPEVVRKMNAAPDWFEALEVINNWARKRHYIVVEV